MKVYQGLSTIPRPPYKSTSSALIQYTGTVKESFIIYVAVVDPLGRMVPLAKHLAFKIVVAEKDNGLEYIVEAAVGVWPSVVYLTMLPPPAVFTILTLIVPLYMPLSMLNRGLLMWVK